MREFLSIIVPHDQEREMDVFPLLSSIANQLIVPKIDYEVIFASMGPDAYVLDTSFLQQFQMNVLRTTISAPCNMHQACQFAMEHAHGKYVMFLPSTWIFHSVGVLAAIQEELEQTYPDILSSTILMPEEMLREPIYLPYKGGPQSHGTLFRRRFLIDHDIQFHPTLDAAGEIYFGILAEGCAEKIEHVNNITLVGDVPHIATFGEFIHAYTSAFERMKELCPDRIVNHVVSCVIRCYQMMHSDSKRKVDKEEAIFVEAMQEWIPYWKSVDKKTILEIYQKQTGTLPVTNDDRYDGDETLQMWLNRTCALTI